MEKIDIIGENRPPESAILYSMKKYYIQRIYIRKCSMIIILHNASSETDIIYRTHSSHGKSTLKHNLQHTSFTEHIFYSTNLSHNTSHRTHNN